LNAIPNATMSVEEAGQRLGISRCLAYELARSGGIPTLRLGRRYVVPISAFDAWLASAGQAA
jgi:excisionase family DNA binding protein